VTRAALVRWMAITLLATTALGCAPRQASAVPQAVFVFVRLSGPFVGAMQESEAALKIGERVGAVLPSDVGRHADADLDGRWAVLAFCGPDADRLAAEIAARIEPLPPGSYMVRRYGYEGAALGPPELLASPGADLATAPRVGSC
jgi:hypothetical protein